MADSPVKLSSYRTDPEPARVHHSATFPLPYNRGFQVSDLVAAAEAFKFAGVPSDATVQVNYGNCVMAMWHVDDV